MLLPDNARKEAGRGAASPAQVCGHGRQVHLSDRDAASAPENQGEAMMLQPPTPLLFITIAETTPALLAQLVAGEVRGIFSVGTRFYVVERSNVIRLHTSGARN
jgi:hypothetical protein